MDRIGLQAASPCPDRSRQGRPASTAFLDRGQQESRRAYPPAAPAFRGVSRAHTSVPPSAPLTSTSRRRLGQGKATTLRFTRQTCGYEHRNHLPSGIGPTVHQSIGPMCSRIIAASRSGVNPQSAPHSAPQFAKADFAAPGHSERSVANVFARSIPLNPHAGRPASCTHPRRGTGRDPPLVRPPARAGAAVPRKARARCRSASNRRRCSTD